MTRRLRDHRDRFPAPAFRYAAGIGIAGSDVGGWTIGKQYVTFIDEVNEMANTYTAVTKQDGKWWIGWIEELPGVNCQEQSHEKLLESLRITLAEAIDLNRQDAISSAVSEYNEELVTI